MALSHRLQQRSCLLQAVRSFFLAREYLEVDTPVLLPELIPESQIVPFCCEERFLQTSPELCMKLLLAGGYARLFQICHCFRKEELGRYHRPEFTMLEWYHVGWGYLELMEEVEELFLFLAREPDRFPALDRNMRLSRGGHSIDLTPPWERMTVEAAFRRFAGTSARAAIADNRFDEILVNRVEPRLGRHRPVFLYDYPVELGSLARRKEHDAACAERFELYIGGIELANGFSELVDPGEQRIRFAAELEVMEAAGRPAAMPERFLRALAAMPDTAGIALGFDRLLMLLAGADRIVDVLPVVFEELFVGQQGQEIR
ncbi:MAG TPA: EF-P lysine aminoacylase GenX [Desulfobulbus sp.]|nr:EF-P lysine aminoacylase GenX [Desulfobulbus sp.]